MGAKQPWNSFSPKKNTVQYVIDLIGFSGSPPRLPYHASQGTTVDRQGVRSFWQVTATGLVVSGADVVTIMSALPCVISLLATCAALAGLDLLSATSTLSL